MSGFFVQKISLSLYRHRSCWVLSMSGSVLRRRRSGGDQIPPFWLCCPRVSSRWLNGWRMVFRTVCPLIWESITPIICYLMVKFLVFLLYTKSVRSHSWGCLVSLLYLSLTKLSSGPKFRLIQGWGQTRSLRGVQFTFVTFSTKNLEEVETLIEVRFIGK